MTTVLLLEDSWYTIGLTLTLVLGASTMTGILTGKLNNSNTSLITTYTMTGVTYITILDMKITGTGH